MYYTGFADEAARDLAGQIRATKELHWQWIESRAIDGVNIHDLPEADFDRVCGMLADSGVGVNCFGSTVANWACHVFNEEEYEATVAALRRALTRMKRLHCTMIRGMSFRAEWLRPRFDPEVEAWVYPRLEKLVRMCEEAGVLYLHENCNNIAGMSYVHTLRMLEKIPSSALKLVFDTGNPVMNFDRSEGDELAHAQSSWEYYRNVRDFIAYVHIKDGFLLKPNPEGFGRMEFTFPGEGSGDVRMIVTDLLRRGYDGGFSMEPHMTRVFHDESAEEQAAFCFENYIEYGRRFMKLVEELKAQAAELNAAQAPR